MRSVEEKNNQRKRKFQATKREKKLNQDEISGVNKTVEVTPKFDVNCFESDCKHLYQEHWAFRLFKSQKTFFNSTEFN